MKQPPNNPEFTRFAAAVRDILKVPKPEMERRIADHKESGKRLPKGASLDPVVSSKLRGSVR
jgi:hypothetical protein